MASFIQGYGYHIFNSCRLQDTTNKGDQWVTVFASAIRSEPEATLEEAVNYRFL